MKIKKLVYMALLTATALILFVVESQIPVPLPIPGIKYGLSNIITLYAVYSLGSGAAFLILITRILLGSMFTGQVVSLMYSLVGGLLCFSVTVIIKRWIERKYMWVTSIIGAVFHNVGQIITACVIMNTTAIIIYLPMLIVSGIVTGLFTGIAAAFVTAYGDRR